MGHAASIVGAPAGLKCLISEGVTGSRRLAAG